MSVPPGQDPGVPAKVAAALERIGQALRVLMQREAQQHGLSPAQLLVLLRLGGDPPERRRPGALAREFDVSPASLSDSIAALERKGLVTRRRVTGDGRGFSLAQTTDGAHLAERAGDVLGPLERAVAGLAADEQVALMNSLFAVIATLQEEGVVSVARMCTTCRHFRPDVHAGPRPHHCALLDVPLALDELRADCPEHAPAARSA